MKNRNFYEAIATLSGVTIGAGIFGIPYVAKEAGFLTTLILIILMTLVTLVINLSVGEYVLRTKEKHQLAGYSEKYLGKYANIIMTIGMMVGTYGAMVAYTIGSAEVLNSIFGSINKGYFMIIYFIICSTIIYYGINTIKKFEFYLGALVILFVSTISAMLIFSGNFDFSRVNQLNLDKILIPYGVVLFAFLGSAAVPEMAIILKHEREKLKKAIIIGTIIPAIVYTLFTFAIVATIPEISQMAAVSIGDNVSNVLGIIIKIFALLAMTTSFLVLGEALKHMYNFDFHINKKLAWGIVVIIPAIVLMLGISEFAKVLNFVGTITGGLEGIVIIMTFWMAKKISERKPEYTIPNLKIIGYIIMLMYIIGIINYLFF